MGSIDNMVNGVSAFWDETATSEIEASMREVKSAIKKFGDAATQIQDLVGDERVKISRIMSNVQSITETLKESDDQVKHILGNVKTVTDEMVTLDFKSVMEDAQKTLQSVNSVLDAATNGGFWSYAGDSVIVNGYEFGKDWGDAAEVNVIMEVTHPHYNDETTANDFMLLLLEESVSTSLTSVTLSLNEESSVPADGQYLTVLGLGDLKYNGTSPNLLRDVVVPVVNTEECNHPLAYDGEVIDSVMFCAGKNKDSNLVIVIFNKIRCFLISMFCSTNLPVRPCYLQDMKTEEKTLARAIREARS